MNEMRCCSALLAYHDQVHRHPDLITVYSLYTAAICISVKGGLTPLRDIVLFVQLEEYIW